MGNLIGADPELFLCDASGEFVSAVGKIGGSKAHPRLIRDDGCAVQEDNVAVEFNIPPAASVEAFVESIKFNLDYLRKHAEGQKLRLNIKASAVFSDEELADPRAREFGCDADYNAWSGRRNPRPKADNPNLRSSGGHVHLSTSMNPQLVARACDLWIGVPSVMIDLDKDRRKLYGRAGTFRRKSYGVEYRTPSNFWLQSEDLMRWIYGASHAALGFASTDLETYDYLEPDSQRIQDCINNSDMGLAKELMDEYGVMGI